MTTYRGQGTDLYYIGEAPPQVEWTVVRGDTSAFRVYVTDDAKQPLHIPDWTIQMQIKRPILTPGIITDNADDILSLTPSPDANDSLGEFTVSLTANQSEILQTGDIFDIELSLPQDEIVWTVAQGKVIVIEDVTA